jgi:hypothetical protein
MSNVDNFNCKRQTLNVERYSFLIIEEEPSQFQLKSMEFVQTNFE